MKKLSGIILLTALLIVICIPFNTVSAQSTSFSYSGSFDMDEFLETFTQQHKDRTTTNYEEERAAAVFLGDYFLNLDYKTLQNTEAQEGQDYLQSFTVSTLKSNNVVAIKPSAEATEKTVIIGAHYDNVYAFQRRNPYTNLNYSTLSHGAYDNGSGVAVMLSVAHDIKNIDLPFNVTFVAFGAEETGMHGSKHFLDTVPLSKRDDILLMINLDSIAGGDYLYLFCQDWKVEHDGFIREVASDSGIPLRSLPFNKKYTVDPFGKSLYSHYGHYSDNYYFLKENIPTAFFMSMNWESLKKAGVVESDRHNDIMHTSNDTYEKLKELYPETYLLHMQYVSETITNLITHQNFVEAMVSSKLNSPDYSFIMNGRNLVVAAFTVWMGLAIFVYIYYGKLKARSQKSIKEYLENPENAEKINILFKGFTNIPPFNDIHYPPNTYKPKKGDKNFSVFGEEYEKKAEDDEQDNNKQD